MDHRITRHRIAFRLSIAITLLMVAQSATGLLFRHLYGDNIFVKSAWYGNDLITLFVATPLMIATLLLVARHSIKAYSIWWGVLAYVFYNYSFYLFGAALNSFFLLYVALFTLSGYALILELSSVCIETFRAATWGRVPVAPLSIYMAVWGVFLTGVWLAQSLNFIFTGTIPEIVIATDHPTNITAALDLSIMVPAVLLGATLIWKRNPWGLVLAIMMNVKGALYALVLATGSIVAARAGIPEVESQIPLWFFLSGASLLCCFLLLGRWSPADQKPPVSG